jgi:hypothetical protein
VVAFPSDTHIAPDMATEVFVLDRPVPGEPSESAEETAHAADGPA